MQNRCVNMIAHLFNAPLEETEAAVVQDDGYESAEALMVSEKNP